MKKVILFFLISILATATISFANDKEEIQMLKDAKISLTDAILIAEKHVGGKASSASIEDDSFSPEFEVTVIKDNKAFDVKINGLDKTVIGVKEDRD